MIAPRFAPLIFAFLMSIYMVTVVSFVITWVNTGMSSGFALRWLRAFYIAWPLAFSLLIIGAPRVQRLVAKCIKPPL